MPTMKAKLFAILWILPLAIAGCGKLWGQVTYSSQSSSLFPTVQISASGARTVGHGITRDSSGNVYIAGYATGGLANATQYGAHGANDAFISKFDPAGLLIWTLQVGASLTTTKGFQLTSDGAGNIYMGASTTALIAGATLLGVHSARATSTALVIQTVRSEPTTVLMEPTTLLYLFLNLMEATLEPSFWHAARERQVVVIE